MYCKECGEQIQAESKFCGRCGAAQLSTTAAPELPPAEMGWETCEITWHRKSQGRSRWNQWFEATAIGSDGPYSVGKSHTFKEGMSADSNVEYAAEESVAIAVLNEF